jgi:L-lactate utilization protein LutB
MAKVTQYSSAHLINEAGVDPERWNRSPPESEIQETIRAIEARNVRLIRANDGDEALMIIQGLVPPGSEVMNGSSTTLIEIGFEQYLQGRKSGWSDLHLSITKENNTEKRADLRRRSVSADYFLSGVNAIARTGELVGCDLTGSRVGAWPFAARKLILVSGINKIVPTLSDALERIREYVYPLESARAQHAYGVPSRIGKCVIVAYEAVPNRITLVLVDDTLGY